MNAGTCADRSFSFDKMYEASMPWSRFLPHKKLFWGLSFFSIALHMLDTYSAFVETNGNSWLGLYNRWGGQLNWLVPWRDESHPRIRENRHVDVAILDALGGHPWINAVGWDVLFSVIALGFWSVLSSTNARDMLRRTVWPTLDKDVEGREAAAKEDGIRRIRSRTPVAPTPRRRPGRPAKTNKTTRETGRRTSRARSSRAGHAMGVSDEGQLGGGFSVLKTLKRKVSWMIARWRGTMLVELKRIKAWEQRETRKQPV